MAAKPRYTTIDWLEHIEARDAAAAAASDALRRPLAGALGAGHPLLLRIADTLRPAQLWIAAVVVGFVAGALAAFVEVATHWVTDLKLGLCRGLFWASEDLCCLADAAPPSTAAAVASATVVGARTTCPAFVPWSQLLGLGAATAPNAGSGRGAGDLSVAVDFVFYAAFAVAPAALAAWLCREFAPMASGSGIVDLKVFLSGVRVPGLFAPRVLLVKTAGLCLSVGSGLSLGKEGPFVHIGAAVAHAVGRVLCPLFRQCEATRRDVVAAGAAAGIAVAFGAPVGAVLFVREEVAYYFPHRTMLLAFIAAIVGTLVLKSLDPTHTGRTVLFAVTYKHPWHWFELPVFVALGAAGGALGALFVRLNGAWGRARRNIPMLADGPVFEAALLALATSAVSFGVPLLKRGMLEVLYDLFRECDADPAAGSESVAGRSLCSDDAVSVTAQLLLAVALKLGLTAVSFGTRVPAGCFVPAMFMGACLGRAAGTLLHLAQATAPGLAVFGSCAGLSICVVPGIYAIVGAASVLSGVTHMTLSLAVITLELTDGLEYVLPTTFAVVAAKWVAGTLLAAPSVYEQQLAGHAYPFVDVADDGDGLPDCSVTDVVDPAQRLAVLTEGTTLATAKAVLAAHPHRWFPVVTPEFDLLGVISRKAVEHELRAAAATGCLDGAAVSFLSEAEATRRSASAVHGSGPSSPTGAALCWAAALDPCSVRLVPGATVRRALHVFRALGVQYAPLVDGTRLAAMVTRRDVLGFVTRYRDSQRRGAPPPGAAPDAAPRTHYLDSDDELF